MKRWLRRSTGFAAIAAVLGLLLVASTASAIPLRVPQVVFSYAPLQNYLNVVDPGINVATQQLNAQVWSVSITGNTDFTLMLKTNLGQNAAVGVYNGNDPNLMAPALFQVFPGAAVPGWYAALHFGGGSLVVTLFNQFSMIMGQTLYPGVNQNNFGFYIQGPGGMWFSQDSRNGGSPQVLTYDSAALPGDYWLCFEELPFNANSTFDGVVINVQSIRPVPTDVTTWGRLKGQYR